MVFLNNSVHSKRIALGEFLLFFCISREPERKTFLRIPWSIYVDLLSSLYIEVNYLYC